MELFQNVGTTPGTVIRATLRPQDLIPALLVELRSRSTADAEVLSKRVPHADVMTDALTIDENHPWWASEDAAEVLSCLFEALNDHSPEGLFFGAHPGDGSDFGWWLEVTDA